jgi:DNA-binding transcriptional ArsR family regulator
MAYETPLPGLEPVQDADRAELLLHPLRQRILSEAREAATAAEIARRVGLPPQKVNYHVRTLVDAGFLRPAGEGRKRNLIEKRYRASARSYVLLPGILGEMSPSAYGDAERFGAAHLIRLGALLQEELAVWLEPGVLRRKGPSTLSLDVEIRFETEGQRAAFADELRKAVAGVVGAYSAPALDHEGRPQAGQPYRLVVGCYPVPDRAPEGEESETEPTR